MFGGWLFLLQCEGQSPGPCTQQALILPPSDTPALCSEIVLSRGDQPQCFFICTPPLSPDLPCDMESCQVHRNGLAMQL